MDQSYFTNEAEKYLQYIDELGFQRDYQPLLNHINYRIKQMRTFKCKFELVSEHFAITFLWTIGNHREYIQMGLFDDDISKYDDVPDYVLWCDCENRPLTELFKQKHVEHIDLKTYIDQYFDTVFDNGYDAIFEPFLEQVNKRIDEFLKFGECTEDYNCQNFLWTVGYQREFVKKYELNIDIDEFSSVPDYFLWNDREHRPYTELFKRRKHSLDDDDVRRVIRIIH